MAVVITSDEVRTWSRLDFDALEYGAPTPPDDDPLDIELERAIAYVEDVTGQNDADIDDPSSLATRFKQAVQLRCEQVVIKRQPDFVADLNEDAIDISVTGYQQKRISYKESDPDRMINPWKELNDLLLSMLTDERRDYWEDLGKIPGANIVRPHEIIQSTEWFHNEWCE